MTSGGAVRIFSSHRWAYSSHRQGLHDLLAPQWVKGVDFVDHSIPKAHPVRVEDDLELARAIQNRIKASDVLLVFAGMYVNFSEWVKLETLCAFFDQCPIIAVVPHGQERVATTATKFASRTVRWRGESIRTAIWDLLPDSRREEVLEARAARAHAALSPRPLPVRDPFAGLAPPLPRMSNNALAGLRLRHPSALDQMLASNALLDLYRKK